DRLAVVAVHRGRPASSVQDDTGVSAAGEIRVREAGLERVEWERSNLLHRLVRQAVRTLALPGESDVGEADGGRVGEGEQGYEDDAQGRHQLDQRESALGGQTPPQLPHERAEVIHSTLPGRFRRGSPRA